MVTWSILPFALLKVNLSINVTMYHVSLVIHYKYKFYFVFILPYIYKLNLAITIAPPKNELYI